jgi:putative ABC transport system permease protein
VDRVIDIWVRKLGRRLRALVRRSTVERELDDELCFHIEREVERRVQDGMSVSQARRSALRDFGGVERYKDDCREVRGVGPLEDTGRDVRYALRSLRRNPGFAAVAALTIALGIGANTAIFSVVNGVLLRPLPYREPGRLVTIANHWEGREGVAASVSPAEYFDYLDRITAVEHFGAYSTGFMSLTGDGEPERIAVAGVSAGVFPALGVVPAIGRTIAAAEDAPNGDVVMLGYGLWQRRYGGSPSVIGRRIILNGRPVSVVGVMPNGFHVPDDLGSATPAEVYGPLGLQRDSVLIRGSHYLSTVARLRPGVTVAQASANAAAVAARFSADFPRDYPERMQFGARALPLRDAIVGEVRSSLVTLLGAVAFVLLIACANVANLLLARTESRSREVAVRTALGAGRGRLVRQFFVEHLVLAGVGGVLGVGLAVAGVRALDAARPPNLPRADEIGLDANVLLFALGATVVTGLLFGLLPAMQAVRADPQHALRGGGRGIAGGARQRLRRMLVVSEISIALVLLAGAGLLVKSFTRLLAVDPGFRPENVLAIPMSLPVARYPDADRVSGFFLALADRVRALPGVRAVGAVAGIPLQAERGDIGIEIEGRPVPPGAARPRGDWQVVTPGYFRAIGMRMVRGREIEPTDGATAPGVVVINEAMARRYWPNADPIGARFTLGGGAGPGMVTIVGIVRDVHQAGLAQAPEPEMYLAHTQFRFWGGGGVLRSLSLVVSTTAEPSRLATAVRGEISALDRDLPVGTIRTMEQVRGESIARPRFMMTLLSTFSAVALAIALVGIYGVMAYGVAQRRREIGVRIALGAQRRDIIRLILGEGLALAGIGVLVGTIGALALTRLIAGFLYGVSPTDPATLGIVAVALTGAAALACYGPVRRATRQDPLVALRAD